MSQVSPTEQRERGSSTIHCAVNELPLIDRVIGISIVVSAGAPAILESAVDCDSIRKLSPK